MPQPVLSPLTAAAVFLVATIEPGGEGTVRDLLADVAALQRSVGFRVHGGGLECVAAIGSGAWDRRYFDERDLIGFVDGTESPAGQDAVAAAIVGAQDPGFAGGSYVIVQKYLHDMTAWNALPVADQERVIGRTKLSNIELPDQIKPANSHVALNTVTGPGGAQRQIVRANMPFGAVGRGEFGTYFVSYAATPAVTEEMLKNMFVGRRPGNTDRILDFSTAVTGGLFFAPSAAFLDDLPGPPGPPGFPDPPGGDQAAAAPRDASWFSSQTAEGSLGIGSLKGLP